MQLTLRRQRLRSVAHAWSAFVNGLVLQQCQLSDIYIFIFHTKFGKDISGFKSPYDDKWLLSSCYIQSSLLDPSFSLHTL